MSNSLYEGMLEIGTSIWVSSVYKIASGVITPIFSDDFSDLAIDASGTFTRAFSAYHTQPNGVSVPCLTNEPRFFGARRVQQGDMRSANQRALLPNDLFSVSFQSGAGASGCAVIASDTLRYYAQYGTIYPTFVTVVGRTYRVTARLRSASGNRTYYFHLGGTITNAITVTSTAQRFSTNAFVAVAASTALTIQDRNASGFSDLEVKDLYIFNVTDDPTTVPDGWEAYSVGASLAVVDPAVTGTTGWTAIGGVGLSIVNDELVVTCTAGQVYPGARYTFSGLTTYTPYIVKITGRVESASAVLPFRQMVNSTLKIVSYRTATNVTWVSNCITTTGTTVVVEPSFSDSTLDADAVIYISKVELFAFDAAAPADGVQYLKTTNGNTIDAGSVVTEAAGAALPGPFGLLREPVATNLCLQSQTAVTTWTQTNVTIAADAVTAPDGTTTADTLTAAADDATWVQTTTAASAQKTWSLWIKRKTGTGTISMSLDGGSTYTDKAITAEWARYSITQTLADPSMVLKIGTNTDAVWVWGSQLEAGAVVTSYIPTTTVEVARAVDALSYTGIDADNETRIVTDAGNVDLDDWDGAMPVPTVPVVEYSVTVYEPGGRPA